jgi:uncharacterized protein
MRVVVNTSPLIALERIGRLHLFRELFGEVTRPQAVADELHAGRERYGLSDDLERAEWILTEPDPPEMVLRRELGAGETAAVSLAHASGADLVVLDDLQARLVAQGLGLTVTGTLGILLAAQQKGLLDDLPGALKRLQDAGFRISTELLKTITDAGR